jgi:hypothetical protein
MNVSLSLCTGLQPLDRVQVISPECLRNQVSDRTLYRAEGARLPYAFFQRVMPDGTLALAGPSGASFRVQPTDVCDVIRGKRLEVMAMRDAKFIELLSLPIGCRYEVDLSWYEAALLTSVDLDRWGRIDRATVQFLNGDPSDGAKTIGVFRKLHPDSLVIAQAFSRRTNLPVVRHKSYAAMASADSGITKSENDCSNIVSQFIKAARQGDSALALRLSECDLSVGRARTKATPNRVSR